MVCPLEEFSLKIVDPPTCSEEGFLLGDLTSLRFQILALDLDGTLLDPQGLVAPETAVAIARAVEAGILPVLCTGRRPRRTFPIARSLGLKTPIVCNSGALIKTLDEQTLWRADWDRDLLHRVVDVFRRLDEPAISFIDRPGDQADFVVATPRTGRPLFDDFLDQNRSFAEVAPGWAEEADRVHFHLTAIGTREAMLTLEQALLENLEGRVQTFVQKSPSYAGTMCEVLRSDANKWTAIRQLCAIWGVEPAQVCAVGDDMNDIPMLRGAGLGVAMGHASPEVRASAHRVTGTNRVGGVAQLINEILIRELDPHAN